MRYSPALYAKSLYEVLNFSKPEDAEKIFKNFWRTLKKNGDESRIDVIVDLFEKKVVRSTGGRVVVLETARDLDPEVEKKFLSQFEKNDLVKKRLNQSLVAGVRIELDGEKELDFSLARRFRKMFGMANI